jgi:hypothetical protein
LLHLAEANDVIASVNRASIRQVAALTQMQVRAAFLVRQRDDAAMVAIGDRTWDVGHCRRVFLAMFEAE